MEGKFEFSFGTKELFIITKQTNSLVLVIKEDFKK